MTSPSVSLLWAASLLAALGCGSERSPRVGSPDGGPLADARTDAPLDGAAPGDATLHVDGARDAAGSDGYSPPLVCNGAGARFVTSVTSHQFGEGQDFGQNLFPAPLFGPPKGGGDCQQSTDVVSLGNGGFVTVEFAGNEIVDEAGPDFIVFENAFRIGCSGGDGGGGMFAELATVSVSQDGVTFVEFPCTATAEPYGSCAGWHPVHANAETNTLDPLDPAVSGGDAFDLADLGLTRARYVRIVDRADITGTGGVFDLDAVGIVHPSCP